MEVTQPSRYCVLQVSLISRESTDRRSRHDDDRTTKRQKISSPLESKHGGSVELPPGGETVTEERKPKRKVAVLLGYSGSGYKGMQLNVNEKTIEGDLFAAMVSAGAISKSNSDDPRKSSLVRCARTDKGVHAAGNVISLKLIVEDPDIVRKINLHLNPQIRVWGIERTHASFSCYKLCDSRVYEYIIPTHVFLPPHPSSHFAARTHEAAVRAEDLVAMQSRQAEVSNFWEDVEGGEVAAFLSKFESSTQKAIVAAIHPADDVQKRDAPEGNATLDQATKRDEGARGLCDEQREDKDSHSTERSASMANEKPDKVSERTDLQDHVRTLKVILLSSKKLYRISAARLARVRDALHLYVGTHNFHNYTVDKKFRDPSAKRHIKSFVADEPFVMGGLEWISLKVHGQSFMMHQIRKMIGMMALVVRSGCCLDRITESYGPDKISIPKAPGLGLLLERPVFDTYNERAVRELNREKIDFDKYEDEINDFKKREIYERIYREEGSENHAFFTHIDGFRGDQFLYVTSAGIDAVRNTASNQPNGQEREGGLDPDSEQGGIESEDG
ncbi:MAG: tRNA pseudouridine synthase 1 [Caeruleum heppii]|nr:MAG: tRNA pseudouridine synthase 1 [Caeruleum heppii]